MKSSDNSLNVSQHITTEKKFRGAILTEVLRIFLESQGHLLIQI